MTMIKVYISGAISGCDEATARKKFADAECVIKSWGANEPEKEYVPVNPLNNGLPYNASWEAHLVRDIEMLLECQAIYMLSDWKDSVGADIEHYIAIKRGIDIIQDFLIFPQEDMDESVNITTYR